MPAGFVQTREIRSPCPVSSQAQTIHLTFDSHVALMRVKLVDFLKKDKQFGPKDSKKRMLRLLHY